MKSDHCSMKYETEQKLWNNICLARLGNDVNFSNF